MQNNMNIPILLQLKEGYWILPEIVFDISAVKNSKKQINLQDLSGIYFYLHI